jgi:hypothetical protein
VNRRELLVAAPQRHLLRALDKSARPLGVFLNIQGNSPFATASRPSKARVSPLEALV